jgi:hypothetical protein
MARHNHRIPFSRDRVMRRALCALLAHLAACTGPTTLNSAPARIAENRWTRVSVKEFSEKGPSGELCVIPTGRYLPDPSMPGVLTDRDGVRIALQARLVDKAEHAVSLSAPSTIDAGEEQRLCFDQPPGMHGAVFQAIELKASAPLVVKSITWRSGQRARPL